MYTQYSEISGQNSNSTFLRSFLSDILGKCTNSFLSSSSYGSNSSTDWVLRCSWQLFYEKTSWSWGGNSNHTPPQKGKLVTEITVATQALWGCVPVLHIEREGPISLKLLKSWKDVVPVAIFKLISMLKWPHTCAGGVIIMALPKKKKGTVNI